MATNADVGNPIVRCSADVPNSFFQDDAGTVACTALNQKIRFFRDSSGHDFHLRAVDANNAYCPPYNPNSDGGRPAAVFGGGGQKLTLGNPEALRFTAANSFTIFVQYHPSASGQWILLTRADPLGNSAGKHNLIFFTSKCLDGNESFLENYDQGGSVDDVSINAPNMAILCSQPWDANDLNYGQPTLWTPQRRLALYSNSMVPLLTKPSAAVDFADQPWTIGGTQGTDGTLNFTGPFQELMIWDRILNAAELRAIGDYSAATYGTATQADVTSERIISIGDSISSGDYLFLNTQSWLSQWSRLYPMGQKRKFLQLGNSGTTGDQLIALAPTRYVPLASDSTYRRNIFVVLFGSNDIWGGQAASSATVIQRTIDLCTILKNAGGTVIAGTIPPRGPGNDANETKRQEHRAYVLANYSDFAHHVWDLAGDPTVGLAGKNVAPYYNGDGIHPTKLGCGVYATSFKAVTDVVFAESQSTAYTESVSETSTISDGAAAGQTGAQGLTDSHSISDGLVATAAGVVSVDDALALVEDETAKGSSVVAAADTLGFTEGATVGVAFAALLVETLAEGGTVGAIVQAMQGLADGNTVGEGINSGGAQSYTENLAEGFTFSESSTATLRALAAMTDQNTIADGLSNAAAFAQALVDAHGVSDSVASQVRAAIAAAEEVATSDDVLTGRRFAEVLAESLTTDDAHAEQASANVVAAETVGVQESAAAEGGQTETICNWGMAVRLRMGGFPPVRLTRWC